MALFCTAAKAPQDAENGPGSAAGAAGTEPVAPEPAPPASTPSPQEEAWLARLESVFAETRWPDA
jgi:hypothetical protein